MDRAEPRLVEATTRETNGVAVTALTRATLHPLLERMEGLLFHPMGDAFEKARARREAAAR